jgi:DNA repair photolyase
LIVWQQNGSRLVYDLTVRLSSMRLEAVRRLREAGLAAGVFASPILPGLTDRVEDLDALACAARNAGAQWLAANVLFLMPSSQKQFLPFLEERFPKLARRYRQWYAQSGYAPETYRREIAARVEALRKKYGLGGRPDAKTNLVWHSPQLALALENEIEPAGNAVSGLAGRSCASG